MDETVEDVCRDFGWSETGAGHDLVSWLRDKLDNAPDPEAHWELSEEKEILSEELLVSRETVAELEQEIRRLAARLEEVENRGKSE